MPSLPYTVQDAENWLALLNDTLPKRAFAIANNAELIGAIVLNLQGRKQICSELGYWLGEPYWGKGLATLAVQKFIKYVFEYYDLIKILPTYSATILHQPEF